MSAKLLIVLLSLATVSCATHEATQINAKKSSEDRLTNAVVSPLADFNLIQTSIPAALTEAVANPYKVPAESDCKGLTDQVQLLDTALGPDLDALVDSKSKSYMDKGEDMAQNEAVGSVERTIQGVIPFRSWVRKLSGAEKSSNELATAVAAGIVRRAFLKGMIQERRCKDPAPTLPTPVVPPEGAPDAPAIQK